MRRPTVHDLPGPLREDALKLAETLREAGHEAWLVGGLPRDLALEREVHDLDLATSATPDEVEALFEVAHAVGRAFGTIVVPGASGPVEITTFRSEREYSDGRRPDTVEFARDHRVDAERRDFTINALYLDPLTDELSDPTGGWADLERSRLRAVGDARARFREDGLRILRLARFAAVLGFEIEESTGRAARAGREDLRGVSAERVLSEWAKAGKHGRVGAFATHLDALDALFVAHPALTHGLEGVGVADLDQRRGELSSLPSHATTDLGLAVLHRPAGAFTHKHAEVALRALHVPRRTLNRARALWENLQAFETDATEPRAEHWRRITHPHFAMDLEVAAALGVIDRECAARWAGWAASRDPAELAVEPLLEARELFELGVPPGPEVGRLLRGLIDAQLEGRVTTREEAIHWVRLASDPS